MKAFNIRHVTIDPPLILAPLAGITHLPFRRMVRKLGRPGLFMTEMLSARAVMRERVHESLYLMTEPDEWPISFQLVAATPEDAAAAAGRLAGDGVDMMDLNLSCPAPEIAKQRKAGAFLLGEPDRVREMVAGIRSVFDGVLTAKVRIGYEPDGERLCRFGRMLEESGVDAVTIHPRLVSEKLKRKARWPLIGMLKRALTVPVIGNGDVVTPSDCARMFEETACDGVMIGREAVRRPWFFRDIFNREPWNPSPEEREQIFRELVMDIVRFFPDRKALGRIKEIAWYMGERMTYGHHFASRIQAADTVSAVFETIDREFRRSC